MKRVPNVEALREIWFLILPVQTEKMVKLLSFSTVCQVFTLGDVEFSWTKYKNNLTWNQAPMPSNNTSVTWNITASRPKIGREHKSCRKIQLKFNNVFKGRKNSLEWIRVTRSVFFCYNTNSRGRLRRILKKISFLQELLRKFSLKKKSNSNVFVQNGVIIC